MKDIFIDNSVSRHFASPVDTRYKDFIKWLIHRENMGIMVVSDHLIREYRRTCESCSKATSILQILILLTRESRIRKVSKEEIANYRFSPAFQKKLRSNRDDHYHIKCVMLSFRQYAVTEDINFTKDLSSCPKFKGVVSSDLSAIPYAAAPRGLPAPSEQPSETPPLNE